MEWYSLRVISGKEMNTQEDIMREISDGGVADQVIEVFVPFEKVENTQGVIRFVGPKGGEPVPLRESEIKRIFGEVERKEGKEILAAPFKGGDTVKVIAGPFIDFTGLVEEIFEEKQKVKVEVSIFGRPTPIELDFFQVEIEK
jgi:transcriptional antiterminator NusG